MEENNQHHVPVALSSVPTGEEAVLAQSVAGRCGEEYYIFAGNRTPATWPVTRHFTDSDIKLKTKLRGLSPRANNSYRATSVCRRSKCQIFRIDQGERYLRLYSRLSRPEPLLYLPSSSSVVLTRLSGPLSRPTTCQKIW
jgi:hypothetical protein